MTASPAAFGATEIKPATAADDPSIASGSQEWKGTIASLNPSPTRSISTPILSSIEPSSAPVETRIPILVMDVVPARPKMKDIPYTMMAEENAPIRKNFTAASPALGFCRMYPTRI